MPAKNSHKPYKKDSKLSQRKNLREIKRSDRFENDLKSVLKKHPDLGRPVSDAIEKIAASGTEPTDDRIGGVGKQPVFKRRLKLRNTGKRGGARLIFYCSEDLVVPLFLYLKTNKSDILPAEITRALKRL